MTTPNQTEKPKHQFVPDSTSPSLNCEVCGESREFHWRQQTEKPSLVFSVTDKWLKTEAELERVKAQRDELLAACKSLRSLVDDVGIVNSTTREQADAAIARTEKEVQ